MNQPPAGWYPDPSQEGFQRYWDGNAWTEQTQPVAQAAPEQPQATRVAPAPPPPPPPPGAAGGFVPPVPAGAVVAAPVAYQLLDVYNQDVDLSQALSPVQIEQYKQHTLTKFPTWLAVVLHFFTLSLFTLIYQGLKLSKLPLVKQDDFTAGKGIGFNFIPFFNLYWQFRFWLGLTDRINFQFRLRGQPAAVPRGFALAVCIVNVIPYVNLIGFLIMTPILSGMLQSATNKLAPEGELGQPGQPIFG